MSDHGKKAWILSFTWVLSVTVILSGVWFALHGRLDGLGWMMVMILVSGAVALVSVFLAAVVVGVATRTAIASIARAICGMPRANRKVEPAESGLPR